MSDAQTLVRSLFTAPGQVVAGGDALLGRAASAHADLLSLAMTHVRTALALAPIKAYLNSSAPSSEKRHLLCHPLFVEGLHTLSPFAVELQNWHDRVTSNTAHPPVDPAAIAALGNVSLVILLRADRCWCGRCELYTDVLGRLGFPFCDWTIFLYSGLGMPLSGRAVSLTLDHDRACWRLDDAPDHPFLVMPRAECERMLIDNDAGIDRNKMTFPDPAIHLKLTCACRLGRSAIRYDPVGFPENTDHAGVTGGLIERIVAAIRSDSPAIYREFRKYIQTIRGFEFPRKASVASFSDPTLPGVMGMSVSYTDQGKPCLDPFCFTWFGHEMGHTKDYLCDTILYSRGESLVTNGGDWSGSIARYNRPLAVRTLIQVPYVHLYEWTLLMDFFEADFYGLPWRIAEGMAAVGNDYAAEIIESFDLIDKWANLTTIGGAAVNHFHDLFDKAIDRWQSLHVLV